MNRLDALMALLVVAGIVVLAPAVLAGPEDTGGDVATVTPAPVPTDRATATPTPAYEDPGQDRELGGYGEELGGDPAGDADRTTTSTALRRGLIDHYREVCHA